MRNIMYHLQQTGRVTNETTCSGYIKLVNK